MSNSTRRRHGDRSDGRLIRDLDAMHFTVPMLYPNRCDNEAFISQTIDLSKTNEYLKKKSEGEEYHYNLFQVIVTATLKTLTLRPKMNRFIANRSIYQRNKLTASFVIKKQFADDGAEGLAVLTAEPDDTIETIHKKIYDQIYSNRTADDTDRSTKSMDAFTHVPLGAAKLFAKFVCALDRHGKVPQKLIATDPYQCSVIFTNLGSIGLQSGYHHLTNWGTNSVFIAIGKAEKKPFYNEDGSVDMRDAVDLGLTIDERIADGYYYSRTVALLKKLIENPELLEAPLSQKLKKEDRDGK